MVNFISPNFGYRKLESPTYEDLLDVFEDRMRNWFLLPAACLLDLPHSQIAAVALLISYVEGIEIYLTGQDSKNKSPEFFANGFFKVFAIDGASSELSKKSRMLSITKRDAASRMMVCSEIVCSLAVRSQNQSLLHGRKRTKPLTPPVKSSR